MMIILGILALVLLLHWKDFFIDPYKNEPRMSEVITEPTYDEALAAMDKYAELQAQIDKVESQKKLDMLKVEKKYSGKLEELATQSEDYAQIVMTFTEQNREKLFDGKKKSIAFGPGKVGVKLNRAKLELVDGHDWEDALKYWKKRNPAYVRQREDLDKTMIVKVFKDATEGELQLLEESGLQIVQEEQVYIKL